MVMGPHQGLTKEHSKFPAEKINSFFVTFFCVKISIIGLNFRVCRVITITVHIKMNDNERYVLTNLKQELIPRNRTVRSTYVPENGQQLP